MTKVEIAKSFSTGNFIPCFEFLTNETIWDTPGEQTLQGKTEIVTFCEKIKLYFDSVDTNFQILNIIENSSHVVINGIAEFIRDGKRISFISSCDIYEFDDSNYIKNIKSYCITEKN